MPEALVIRHAQSTWNESGQWQGQADPPLTALGEEQAGAAAARLSGGPPFDLVFSSDLIRARRTAELVAVGLGLRAVCHLTDEGLREIDVGEWSGLTRAEIESGWPGRMEEFARGEAPAPEGETRQVFDGRVAAALHRVTGVIGEKGAERVLIVTHGGVVRSMARTAGLVEGATQHLSGYWTRVEAGGIIPGLRVDLLDSAG